MLARSDCQLVEKFLSIYFLIFVYVYVTYVWWGHLYMSAGTEHVQRSEDSFVQGAG